jgi:hypothetical protein
LVSKGRRLLGLGVLQGSCLGLLAFGLAALGAAGRLRLLLG